MNLGVETPTRYRLPIIQCFVSAFSDESWGGDPVADCGGAGFVDVSAFSDESWGGDPVEDAQQRITDMFQHSLMNLGVETEPQKDLQTFVGTCFSIL